MPRKFAGGVDLTGSKAVNVADPSSAQDAATKAYVDARRLDQIAAPTGDVSLNSHKLVNVTDPGSAQDAATKNYVDTRTLNNFVAPTADLSINSHKLTNVTDPASAQDAATKAYVDALVQGIKWKAPVRAAQVGSGPGTDNLATAYENGDVLDGVTLATGDRVLIAWQATPANNGIYTVNASGSPTRATDADAASEMLQATVLVQEGTANADTLWVQTTNAPITLGSTALNWVNIQSGTTVTGDSGPTTIVRSGNILSTNPPADSSTPPSDGLGNTGATGIPRMAKHAIRGDGAITSWTRTHNFNTRQLMVMGQQAASAVPATPIELDWVPNGLNAIDVVFPVAPAAGVVYYITILG